MSEIMERPATMWTRLPVVMDIETVSMIFGISVIKLRKMAREGSVPAFKVGKMWRFEKSALMKFCGAIGEGSS